MKVANNTDRDLSSLQKILTSFLPYAKERLGYDKPCCVNFVSDIENSKKDFGKTAYYDPSNMEIVIYVDGRHPKDMLRSISHELVHHAQNCRGDFDFQFETKPGYAQNNQKLRELEAEAYLLGNGFLVRDFEDSIKLGDQVLMEWKNKKKKVLKEAQVSEPVEKALDHSHADEKMLSAGLGILNTILDDEEIPLFKKLKERLKSAKQKRELFMFVLDLFGLGGYLKQFPSDALKIANELDKQEKQETQQKQAQNEGKKKPFPDLTGDGKVTKADVLKGRGVKLDDKPGKRGEKEDDEKENVKEHYITRSEIVGNELMKRWFSKK
jgi:hypothetical protein